MGEKKESGLNFLGAAFLGLAALGFALGLAGFAFLTLSADFLVALAAGFFAFWCDFLAVGIFPAMLLGFLAAAFALGVTFLTGFFLVST